MLTRRPFLARLASFIGLLLMGCGPAARRRSGPGAQTGGSIALPPPRLSGSLSIEAALQARRSVRGYKEEALTLAEVAQLLWAAQGVTHGSGFRTAPSAGALYPLETYLVAGQVEGLAAGIYRYVPADHALTLVVADDAREALTAAALGQSFIRQAPAALVFAAVFERTSRRYGLRGTQYVHNEVGHAGQSVHLQALSLGLGTVVVGAFGDAEVRRALHLPAEEQPVYIMPVGRV